VRRDLDVTAYLDDLDDARRPAGRRLRRECRRLLSDFDENFAYRMPSYSRDAGVEIAFKFQARYVSFYVARLDVMTALRPRMSHLNVGKGCVRFSTVDRIDWELVDDVLELTAASLGPIC
jgi:hypothetical protein